MNNKNTLTSSLTCSLLFVLALGALAPTGGALSGNSLAAIAPAGAGGEPPAAMAAPAVDLGLHQAAVGPFDAARAANVHHAQWAGGHPGGVAIPTSGAPSAALAGWLDDSGIATRGLADDLVALDAATATYAPALTALVDAFSALDAEAQAARDDPATGPGGVFAARERVIDALESLPRPAPQPAAAPCTPLIIDSPPTLFFALGGCDTPHPSMGIPCIADDYQFIFDNGGNDVYCNNAGGNGADNLNFASAIMVNLGGNDQYIGGNHGRTHGINGGAHGAGTQGILYDDGGDDLYRAGKHQGNARSAANGGAANGGTGMLLDIAGDDTYQSGWDGGNGGASHGGSGTLVDGAGSDTYTGLYGAKPFGGANGGAFTGGSGYLRDLGGNDIYNAGSVGVNGGADGCVGVTGAPDPSSGVLWDDAGDDHYTGRYVAVNGAAIGGTALLYDGGGNDRYVAKGTKTNGAGDFANCGGIQSPGSGQLLDAIGCDWYDDNYPGATGWDVTVAPKGAAAGAQTDTAGLGCNNVADDLTTGLWHTCVNSAAGNVYCWGANHYGQSDDDPTGDNTGVGAGNLHTCRIINDDDVECQGLDNYGQATDQSGIDAIEVAGGLWHTCALQTGGTVDCWGYNGHGSAADYTVGDAVEVDAGAWHTCIRLANGNVDCRGYGLYGAQVDYTAQDAEDLDSGAAHNCVVTTLGNVNCWGWNATGQDIGYYGGDAVEVAAGRLHTCALLSNGDATCWGDNAYDQTLGYTEGDAVGIDAHGDHTCVIKQDGSVECWGRNQYGQTAPWP